MVKTAKFVEVFSLESFPLYSIAIGTAKKHTMESIVEFTAF